MKIINPSFEILTEIDEKEILKKLELAGRICYKSEHKTTEDSCYNFINMIRTKNHQSVLEHFSITVKFTIDRAIANELVRHRLASFSQTSTRYVNYDKDQFGSEISVIKPKQLNEDSIPYFIWLHTCELLEKRYMELIKLGVTAQNARSILPCCLMTEIVMTANIREWLHVFDLRCSNAAHPDMRDIMIPVSDEFERLMPVLFKKIQKVVD
jgi:thymidylate synthase (FAD)